MLSEKQLAYLEGVAIQRIFRTGQVFLNAVRQLQKGDALGRPLPREVIAKLETDTLGLFERSVEGIKILNNALKEYRLSENTELLDAFIKQNP